MNLVDNLLIIIKYFSTEKQHVKINKNQFNKYYPQDLLLLLQLQL